MSKGRFRFALPAGYTVHWYEIQSVLGQGGFGITYLARDNNLDQLVAIKEFLPTELAVRTHDSEVHPISDGHSDTFGWGLDRFMKEARTLAQFKHPNIVPVLSVFEANNTAYMVMAYEHGRSLEDAFRFRRVKTEANYLAVLLPVLDGLELVHGSGFIHRDIKPDNIFLRRDGTPVLLDFGSARQAIGAQTRTLTTLVSPGYAPFEQYQTTTDADRQGPWTDIYSVAATFYRGIADAEPVDALARVNAVLESKPDPLRAAAEVGSGRFSPVFLAALDAGLRFQPGDRPQSVGEWRAMLDGVEPVTTPLPAHAPTAPANLRPRGSPDKAMPTFAPGDAGAPTVKAETRQPPAAPYRPLRKEPASRRGIGLPMLALGGIVLAAAGWLFFLQPPDESLTTPDAAAVAGVPGAEEGADGGGVTGEAAREGAAVEARRQAAEKTAEQAARQEAARLVDEGRQKAAEAERLAEEAQIRVAEETARAERERQARAEAARLEEERKATEARNVEINDLLGKANDDLNALRLTSPEGNNAFERYQRVLELEPDHQGALEGLGAIVARYLELAAKAADGEDFDKSFEFLDRAEGVLPGDTAVADARAELGAVRAAMEAERHRQAASTAPSAAAPESSGSPGERPVPITASGSDGPAASGKTSVSDSQAAGRPLSREPFLLAVFPFAVKNSDAGQSALSGIVSDLYINDVRFTPSYDYYREFGAMRAMVRQPDGSVAVDYQFGDRARNAWGGTATEPVPNQGRMFELGRLLEIDLAVTYFIEGKASGGYDVDAYLFDVRLRRSYQRSGDESDAERLTRELFDEFLAARTGTPAPRPAVIAAKPAQQASASAAPASLQVEKPLSVPPFESAVFPFAVQDCKPSLACGESGESDLKNFSRELLASDGRFTPQYNYYVGTMKDRAMTRQPDGSVRMDYRFGDKARAAWSRNVTAQLPDESRMFDLGKALDVDFVLTYYIEGRPLGNYDIIAYVFDVRLKRSYRKQGNQSNAREITREVLREFVAGRESASG